jgi:hypothetical protein
MSLTEKSIPVQPHNKEGVNTIPTPTDSIDIPAPACAVGDTACIDRWISAFSDCD